MAGIQGREKRKGTKYSARKEDKRIRGKKGTRVGGGGGGGQRQERTGITKSKDKPHQEIEMGQHDT
jgi:hypothetical protein